MQDRGRRFLYANRAAANLAGFASAEEFLNTPMQQVQGKFDLLDEAGQILPHDSMPGRAVFDGMVPPEKLVRFRIKATGEERWSVLRARPVGGDGNRPAFVVNVFHDVTEQRRHDEILRVSREWFSMALKSVGDAVLATDERGVITFMNPAAESLTGWQLADAMGLPHQTVFSIVNEDTHLTLESPVDVVLREGQVVGLANHTILTTKRKGEVSIDDSAAPIKESTGNLVGTVGRLRRAPSEARLASHDIGNRCWIRRENPLIPPDNAAPSGAAAVQAPRERALQPPLMNEGFDQ